MTAFKVERGLLHLELADIEGARVEALMRILPKFGYADLKRVELKVKKLSERKLYEGLGLSPYIVDSLVT